MLYVIGDYDHWSEEFHIDFLSTSFENLRAECKEAIWVIEDASAVCSPSVLFTLIKPYDGEFSLYHTWEEDKEVDSWDIDWGKFDAHGLEWEREWEETYEKGVRTSNTTPDFDSEKKIIFEECLTTEEDHIVTPSEVNIAIILDELLSGKITREQAISRLL